MASPLDVIWLFVQGKLPVVDFEPWCYRTPELETLLGKDGYLDLLCTRFEESQSVVALKRDLHASLQKNAYPTCECPLWGTEETVPLTSDWTPQDVASRMRLLLERTRWLELRRCLCCGQAWYVACDTVDDDWHFKRMSEEDVANVLDRSEWPRDFDGESKCGLGRWWNLDLL